MPDPAEDVRVVVIPRQPFLGVAGIDGEGPYSVSAKTGERIEGTPPAELVALGEALNRCWTDDHHILLYRTEPHDEGDPVFRVNISALKDLAARHGRVVVNIIAVDLDTSGVVGTHAREDHGPWIPELWDRFMDILETRAPPGSALRARLDQARAFYTTRGGARWIWVLDEPLDVAEANSFIYGLQVELSTAGLPIDMHPTTRTWGQPYRLPRVQRGESRSEDGPFFLLDEWPGRVLPRASIAPVMLPSLALGDFGAPSRPVEDEAVALIGGHDTRGRHVLTDFGRVARTKLEGRPYWKFLFDVEPLDTLSLESRHDTLKEWTASAAGLLSNEVGWSAAAMYGLFVPIARQMQAQHEGPPRNFLDEVWRQVTWVWQREAKRVHEEQAASEAAAVAEAAAVLSIEDGILLGVRSWWPDLPVDDTQALGVILSRAIVYYRQQLFVLRRDGFYDKHSVPAVGEVLAAKIENLGMAPLLPTKVAGKDGTLRPASYAEMARDRMVVARDIEMRPELPGSFLEDPDSPHPLLVILSFRRRTDLTPEFSADVDEIIRAFGGLKYETLNEQLGKFLAWECGAVPGMSFVKPSGSGKKMFARAIEECLDPTVSRQISASGADLQDNFNGTLAETPLVLVNEGLKLDRGSHAPADNYRRMVTADDVYVNQKFMPMIRVRTAFRMLITANSEDIILGLYAGRDLTPGDREALAKRLIHYPSDDAAVRLLERKGGMAWTEGWIRGDGGQPSRFVFAKHLLWLYEKYGRGAKPYASHGLLMAGDSKDSPIMRTLQVQGGKTPTVVEAIVGMVSKHTNPAGPRGWEIEDEHLYVTVSGVKDFHAERALLNGGERLTLKAVENALKGLQPGVSTPRTSVNGHAARWKEIDVEVLHQEMERYGWSCDRIEGLADVIVKRREGMAQSPQPHITSESGMRIG